MTQSQPTFRVLAIAPRMEVISDRAQIIRSRTETHVSESVRDRHFQERPPLLRVVTERGAHPLPRSVPSEVQQHAGSGRPDRRVIGAVMGGRALESDRARSRRPDGGNGRPVACRCVAVVQVARLVNR